MTSLALRFDQSWLSLSRQALDSACERMWILSSENGQPPERKCSSLSVSVVVLGTSSRMEELGSGQKAYVVTLRVNETLSQKLELQKVKKIPEKPKLLFSAVFFLVTNGLDSSQPAPHQKW